LNAANLNHQEDGIRRRHGEVIDIINDRYGEFVITPALMMGMDEVILDCIAFGGVKELEELYQQ
jgi:hypothetical protein